MIEFLRTPDERFKNLSEFPYIPHYFEDLKGYDGLRMHYIDEGPSNSKEAFFCLHGQPTWSYLYRKMIPVFLDAGYRVIALDFYGFGRSDKPIKDKIYTFNFHRNSLIEFIKKIDLKNLTLVCQDWGGVLGLTLPMEFPDKFKRLIIMNTILSTGDYEITPGFKAFRDWVNKTPDIEAGRLIKRVTPALKDEEIAAYNAPFPDSHYKAGIRTFPNLVPTTYDAPGAEISRKARDWFQKDWKGESFMAIGMQDPVLGPSVMRLLRKWVPNCPEPLRIKEASHFVQEWGNNVAKKALKHFDLL